MTKSLHPAGIATCLAVCTALVLAHGFTFPDSGERRSACIAEFRYLDSNADRVGEGTVSVADGVPDGRFLLRLHSSDSVEIKSIVVLDSTTGRWRSDAKDSWIIGVFKDGTQLNRAPKYGLCAFSGGCNLEILISQHRLFGRGQSFQVGVSLSNGSMISKVCTIE